MLGTGHTLGTHSWSGITPVPACWRVTLTFQVSCLATTQRTRGAPLHFAHHGHPFTSHGLAWGVQEQRVAGHREFLPEKSLLIPCFGRWAIAAACIRRTRRGNASSHVRRSSGEVTFEKVQLIEEQIRELPGELPGQQRPPDRPLGGRPAPIVHRNSGCGRPVPDRGRWRWDRGTAG